MSPTDVAIRYKDAPPTRKTKYVALHKVHGAYWVQGVPEFETIDGGEWGIMQAFGHAGAIVGSVVYETFTPGRDWAMIEEEARDLGTLSGPYLHPHADDALLVFHIWVADEYRGRGIATQFMRMLADKQRRVFIDTPLQDWLTDWFERLTERTQS